MEPVLDTLQEAIVYFSDPVNCREYVVARRWPKGVECPRCGSQNVAFLERYNRWQCSSRHDARQFTAKTGTVRASDDEAEKFCLDVISGTIGGVCGHMKTPPPVDLPEGRTPAERLDMAFRKVLTVPKEVILKAEQREKRQRQNHRKTKS